MVRATKGKRSTMTVKRARANQKQIEGQSPEWVININKRCKEGPQYDCGKWLTIYRVPKNIREVHKNAFAPKIISIGPLHYGDPGLRFMEEHKMRYLLRLLGSRTPENAEQAEDLVPQVHQAILLEDLEGAMRELEQKTRQCYAGAFDIDSNDFVQMMVIDGCFVLELLRLYNRFEREDTNIYSYCMPYPTENVDDPIFTIRWMLRTLQRDLLKLENQLPFFDPPLIDLVLTFFDPLLPRKNIKGNLNPEGEFDHMLEVFRSTFLSSVNQDITSGCEQLKISVNVPLVQERQLIHSVTELEKAGVKLKKRKDCDLLDINFQAGVLKIPPLYIDDNTAVLFLNFPMSDSSQNGIINHVLGSDQDVADLFNKLGREVVYDLDECYLSQQIKRVNNYCKTYYASKWRVWFTNLKHDYFSNPWTFSHFLRPLPFVTHHCSNLLYCVWLL
ncbi:hypothetical protein AAG906_010204 [Vitis piasezkii]